MNKKMKYSGVDWIGKIPEDWEVIRIGSVFNLRNDKVNDIEYKPLSVSKAGIVPQMENVAKSDDSNNRKKVLENDFVINSRSDRKLSCGVSFLNGSVSVINTILYVNQEKQIIFKYPNYLMKNYGFAEEFYRWGHGIVADLWTTKWQEMKNILLPIPPHKTQNLIVEILDKKCSQIDNLITNQQQQIEKLKQYKQSLITEVVTKGLEPNVPMKDSGVEWIGEIPEDWEINRIKYICEFNPSSKKLINSEDEISYAPMECIKNGYMIKKEIKYKKLVSGLTYFEENDILMAKVTPCFENGNIAIATDLKNNIGYGSSELFVFRAFYVNTKWFFYFLRNNKFNKLAKATMTGTGGLKRVSANLVKNLFLAIPKKEEQEKIANYLDEKCSQIDNLIKIKEKKIEKLNEYKKSLIYEYVTGKKEV